MSSNRNQNLIMRLEEAKSILDSDYEKFQEIIDEFNINLDTPQWDIVCFLIFTDLGEKSIKKQKWIDFWHRSSITRKYKNLVYIVPASYIQLSDRKKAVDFFLDLLNQNKKLSKNLDWKVYLSIFFQFRSSIRPKFTKRDFTVFSTILQNQTMNTTELSEILKIDKSNISRYKNNLVSRRVLHQGISLNHHRLNLRVYGTLFEYPLSNRINLFDELSYNDLVHSVYSSNIGCNSSLVYYVTPKYDGVFDDLQKFAAKFCQEKDIPYSRVIHFLTSTRLKSFNYSSYDYKKGQWNLTPSNIQLTLSGSNPIEADSTVIFTRDFEISNDRKLALNRTGIDILNHILSKNHLSIREVQRDLELTEKETKKHINYLRNQDLYRLRYNPAYVFGLKNLVLFLGTPHSDQIDIHKKLSFFPEVYSEQYTSSEKKGLYFVIRIPNELLVESIETLSDYFHEEIEKIFTVDQMYSKKFLLPKEKYETVFQEWKYSPEDILGRIKENG